MKPEEGWHWGEDRRDPQADKPWSQSSQHTHSFYVLKEEEKQEVSAERRLSCSPEQQAWAHKDADHLWLPVTHA